MYKKRFTHEFCPKNVIFSIFVTNRYKHFGIFFYDVSSYLSEEKNFMEQDILIYIDDKEKLDASVAANSFAHKDIKNRAYINTLGAELAMKYLVSENVDVSDVKNLHSIKKILEEMDIADIMLSNIHIDVRVVFDENIIFIPKSHFEYDILPDIYLVFNLSKDNSYVKFLGFFEPKLINKNNSNSDYYFIEKEKLSSAKDLINYINSHKTSETGLSQNELELSERFIVSVYDNDISEGDKKQLLKQLTQSVELRDKFIEFENFETLSYKAMNDPMIKKKEISLDTDTTDIIDTINTVDETPENITQTLDVLELDDNSLDLNDFTNLDELTDIESTAAETPTSPETPENLETTDRVDISGTEFSNMATNLAEGVVEGLAQGAVEGAVGGLAESAGAMGLAEGLAQGLTGEIVEGAVDLTQNLTQDIINTDDNITQETTDAISFDEVDLSENTDSQVEAPTEDTISLENIDLEQPQDTTIEEPITDLMSFDNIEPLQTEDILPEESIDLTSLDKVENLDNNEILEKENLNENLENLPEINEIGEINDIGNIESDNDLENITLDDITETNPQDDIENNETKNSDSSFGKNLLENLSAEDEEKADQDINIDDIELDETAPKLADDISSDDLLSQIDDILNTSSTENAQADFNYEETDNSENNQTDLPENNVNEIIESSESESENETEDVNIDNITSIENLTESESSNSVDPINEDDSTNDNLQTQNDTNIENSDDTENDNDLNVLYNEDATDAQPELPEEEPQVAVPGVALYNKKSTDKKPMMVASALIVLFAISSAFLFMKPKNDNSAEIEPLPTSNEIPTQTENQPTDDILASNAPQTPTPVPTQKDIAVTKPVVKELKNTPPKTTKAEPYIEVSKLVWDVPNELSYSSKMQNYLRTAGKSIKLSLSTDLLLATEYAYTNQIKVGLKLDKNGSIRDARILSSSGSTQIDKIVLQSVKDTLNVVKPPTDEISTPEFNLNLIIYI